MTVILVTVILVTVILVTVILVTETPVLAMTLGLDLLTELIQLLMCMRDCSMSHVHAVTVQAVQAETRSVPYAA